MRGRRFTQQGQLKAISKAIRALQQQVEFLNKLWGSYEEWLGINAENQSIDLESYGEVLEAQDNVERETTGYIELVETLKEAIEHLERGEFQ